MAATAKRTNGTGPDAKKLKQSMPDNFFSKEFLTQHVKDIISFYEPRVVDKTGGFFQSFYIDGTSFNPGFRQIVSSARMVINFMLAGKLLGRQELIDIGIHGLDYLEKVHYVAEKDCYSFTVKDHKPDDMIQQAYGDAFILAAHAAARLAADPAILDPNDTWLRTAMLLASRETPELSPCVQVAIRLVAALHCGIRWRLFL